MSLCLVALWLFGKGCFGGFAVRDVGFVFEFGDCGLCLGFVA